MELEQRHIAALDEAETLMVNRNFLPYLELKELLHNATPQARGRFRSLFTNHFGLNVGGLTDEFKDRYFEILFGGNVIANNRPNFSIILNELSLIPRKTGNCAMPFSFVSKLVAIHMESSPIYDRHVVGFFGVTTPAASVPKPDRISWFIRFLDQVVTDYAAWAQNKRMIPILQRLVARDARLAHCHVSRLVDFLVWKAGSKKLLKK